MALIQRDAPPGRPGAARRQEHTGLPDIPCVPAQPSPGTRTFLPAYALQEPEVELLLRVLWPARVVDEHQTGWRTPPDLPAGWEGEFTQCRGTTVGG